ncbi:Pleckstrin homology-like domain family B member 2 [Halotydeus destructor]|nr:Pleckstrin homology-like domain family B member 2 [Halotydeus destructor]
MMNLYNGQIVGSGRVGSLEYLDKVRLEREREEEVKRIEEERLREIISFCEKYNEMCRVDGEKKQQVSCSEDEERNGIQLTMADDEFRRAYNESTNHSPSHNGELSVKTKASSPAISDTTTSGTIDDESSSSTLVNHDTGSSETLNALNVEKALLQNEFDEINRQTMSETEDEELKEFQKIEKEIRLSEISHSLEKVYNQIEERRSRAEKAVVTKPPMVPRGSQIRAPLASAETSDDSDGESVDEELMREYKCDFTLPMGSTRKKSSSLPPNEVHSVKIRKATLLQQQRSMTLYVPTKDGPRGQGLVAHLGSLNHDLPLYSNYLQVTCCTCSGYLWKLCSKSSNKWKKRFFHFDRHYKVFFYYKTLSQFKKVKKPNGGVYFDEIRDVYIDRARTKHIREKSTSSFSGLTTGNRNQHRCVFVVETAGRQFVLSTFIWEVMRIWIDVIFTAAEPYNCSEWS